MSLFTKPEHASNSPATWTVRKHGSKWGVFAANQSNPIDTFTTRAAAIEATTHGRLVDLYEKERRWYAGDNVLGWKPSPYRDTTKLETP